MVILALVLGCAGSKKQAREGSATESGVKLDESFDPLLLDDEDITFKEKKPQPVTTRPVIIEPEPGETEIVNQLVDGFRIQIISTKNLENATKAKLIAFEQFSDLQVNFYLEFDSPYYKVRVGDFKSRDAAENIQEIIRSRGYPKAWIVKTKVWTNPEIPVLSDSTDIETPEIN